MAPESDADRFGGWQPTTERAVDSVGAGAAAALHGLLDAPGPPPGAGDPLPPLWHWLAFLPRVAQADLGDDGHPRPGAFLPPVGLPRRMFAGGRVQFAGAPRVGAELLRQGTVESVVAKDGRSGRLVFVTARYDLGWVDGAQPGGTIVEQQDLVYREAANPAGGAGDGGAAGAGGAAGGRPAAAAAGDGGGWDEDWSWGFELEADPRLLFRFSALTYNAHRIHYDRDWATNVEHYPGLVVHGPLQAIALADLCRRHLADRPMVGFRFRALAPAFDGDVLHLRGRWDGGEEVELVAFDGDGRRTLEAAATLATLSG